MKKSLLLGLALIASELSALPQQAKQQEGEPKAQKEAPDIPVGLCVVNVTNNTIRIVPWDLATEKWKQDSARIISWDSATELVSGTNKLTMAQFVAGKPLSDDVKNLSELHGERARISLERLKGKEVMRRAEMILLFKGESFPGYITLGGDKPGFQRIGSMKVPCCDRSTAALSATSVDLSFRPESRPRVDTTFNLERLDVMSSIGGGASDFTTLDLSFATGTYTQVLDEKKATGKVHDLGAIQVTGGRIYPMLLVSGEFFLVQSQEDTTGKRNVERVTNETKNTLAPKDKVWTSKDGKTSIYLLKDVGYMVLDPASFPRTPKAIGIADSKFLYQYTAP